VKESSSKKQSEKKETISTKTKDEEKDNKSTSKLKDIIF